MIIKRAGPLVVALAGLAVAFGLLMVAGGCPGFSLDPTDTGNTNTNSGDPNPTAKSLADECAACHKNIAEKYALGTHKAMADECVTCHSNAREHMADPTVVKAKLNFALSACSSCHGGQYDSYLHDDASKPGHFGGSIATSKYLEYDKYQYLMGGHGFTRQYNEERAHGYMLKDHIDTQRKQTTTCLQCKSTPVAYYWNSDTRGSVQFEKSQDWATVVQRIRDEYPETIDYGAGCTHCHDPHNGDFRIIRRGVIEAILERGTDPYSTVHNVIPASEAELQGLMNERDASGERTERAMRLAGTLTCAQCHIEYVCGQGADRATTGTIRDYVPWRKLPDIEAHYKELFNLQQDWTHSVTGMTGIKPQHPETESYWGSSHHMLGMSCADCHMAKTTDATGKTVASHWLTSPLKNNVTACGKCHDDVQADLFAVQDAFYAKAVRVQNSLNTLLQKIGDPATAATIPAGDLTTAKALFMRAITWWEWVAVSENSMSAHNADEMDEQLDYAESLVAEALALFP